MSRCPVSRIGDSYESTLSTTRAHGRGCATARRTRARSCDHAPGRAHARAIVCRVTASARL